MRFPIATGYRSLILGKAAVFLAIVPQPTGSFGLYNTMLGNSNIFANAFLFQIQISMPLQCQMNKQNGFVKEEKEYQRKTKPGQCIAVLVGKS